MFRAREERERIVSTFGQQVSAAVVEHLLKAGPEIASTRNFVCVMFMDIRNFTPLVERKSPEEIVAFQNVVFAEAVEIVNRNHGIINQFLGDGFMATFGAPLATGRDCGNALAAAHDLVAGIRRLSEAGLIPPIMIGVGLHAGEVVCGNVGSALRKQYSITRLTHRAAEQGPRIADSGVGRGAGGRGRIAARRPVARAGARQGARGANRDLPARLMEIAGVWVRVRLAALG